MNWSQLITDMVQNVLMIWLAWQIGTLKGKAKNTERNIKEIVTVLKASK